MSKNINQVFISNPASSMQATDLFYLGRSPYGLTNDMAILWSNVLLSLAGTFLERSNNLSDLGNQLTAYQNFGMGARSQITYTDSDFPVVLTNPCPNIITLNCSSPGHTLQLPDAQGAQAFELFNGPEIINLGTQRVSIVSFLGVPQTPSQPNSDFHYLLTDNSTHGGIWDARGHINTINGTTGNVVFTSNDGSVTITPDTTEQTVDLSVSTVANVVYQQLYVNNTSGNDSNSGSILEPMKTYDAARLKAISLGASITNRFQISIVGGLTIAGNMTLSPFISVVGLNDYQTTINISGNVQLDSSWGSTSTPFMMVRNINFLGAGSISLVFPSFQIRSFVRFQDCSIQLGSVTITGAGTSTACETVVFNNCNNDSNTFFPEPSYNATNVNLLLVDTNPSNNVVVSVTSNTSLATFYLIGSQTVTGNVNLNASAIGTLTTYIGSSFTNGKTLTINGTSNTVNVDASAYMFTLALSGSATLSNINILSKSDGITGASYTPVNFTGIAGSLYKANSLTGYIAGIDAALVGTATIAYQQLYVNPVSGSDANSGSINQPFQTYDAARLKAISLGASITNRFQISLVGDFTIAGNMTLSPFISVVGLNDYATVISISGNVQLDSSWGSTSTPFMMVRNINFIGAGAISLTYPSFQIRSFIRFQDCSIQLASVTITGAGTSTACETITFNNCNNDSNTFFGEPTYSATNVNLSFFNTNPSNSITVSVTSSTSLATCYIIGCQTLTGNIHLNATSTGTLTTSIISSSTQGRTLTVTGASNTVNVDSSSYMFTLSLASGATLSNINVLSKSDGITAASYSPVNFTGIAGAAYQANSSTGYFAGIDAALGSALQWKVITASQTMVPGQAYITNSGSLVSLALPSSLTVGQVFAVSGFGTGGWIITQSAGQLMVAVNNNQTTTGVTGSAASDASFPRSGLKLVVVSSTTLLIVETNGIVDLT